MTLVHDIRMTILIAFLTSWHHFSAKRFNANMLERRRTEQFLLKKCSYFGVKLIKQYLFNPKCNCRRQGMLNKKAVMVVRCELKIPSLRITVQHQSASLVMPNSYPCDGIFSPHLTTIKDSYNVISDPAWSLRMWNSKCLLSCSKKDHLH